MCEAGAVGADGVGRGGVSVELPGGADAHLHLRACGARARPRPNMACSFSCVMDIMLAFVTTPSMTGGLSHKYKALQCIESPQCHAANIYKRVNVFSWGCLILLPSLQCYLSLLALAALSSGVALLHSKIIRNPET